MAREFVVTSALTTSYVRGPDEEVLDITVGDLLRMAVAVAPDRVALVDTRDADLKPAQRRRWTYTELLADAEALARSLLQRYEPGAHLAIFAPNVAEFSIFQYGVALAGMVMVTINPTFRRDELAFSLRQSRANAVFAWPEFRGSPLIHLAQEVAETVPTLGGVVSFEELPELIEEGRHEQVELPVVDPLGPAQIQYTSGTTGSPKGAMIRHRGMTNDARFAGVRGGATDGCVWLAALPMFHVGGCVLAGLGCLARAGTLVPLFNFDAARALELIEQEGVTIFNPVPTMLVAMAEDPSIDERDLSSLSAVISGGAPVPADMVRQIESRLGVDFTIVLGMTETSGVITMTTTDDTPKDKAETCGRPLPGVEVKIVDPATGATQPIGEVGEFLTRGYHTLLEYHDEPEATAAALEPDGWFHTGDLCSMDERGYITIEGRLKDMIIRGGENIYPREIEDLLFEHEAVREAVVVGIPDEYYGEVAAAFVVPAGNLDVGTLQEFLASRLSGYKIPARWYQVEKFPQTLSGKIQKFEIRRQWAKGAFDHAEVTP